MDLMSAELITVGDELLYGQTIDTNAAFIGEKLSEAGIELDFHTTVGDQPDKLLNAIGQAFNRVDIVLTTGGLGPTHDDITKKVICKFFKRQLVFHEDILKKLEKKYASQGMTMPYINQNQALLPQGAKFIDNKIGSALGIIIEDAGKIFVAIPGVPNEMKIMMTEHVIPILERRGSRRVIVHRRIRTIGITESAIYEKVKSTIDEKSAVRIAFLPGLEGVDVRLTVKSDDKEKAKEAIEDTQNQFIKKIGDYIFGYDDDELPVVTGKLLLDKKMTLAVAESCTGGWLGKLLTDIPGSSAYFWGGVIAYTDEIKIKILSVPAIVIERHGAVSIETAKYMAEGVKNLSGASIGMSITGIAGPSGGSPSKPVGLTYIGISTPEGTSAKEYHYGRDRNRNRMRASCSALDMLRRHLLGME